MPVEVQKDTTFDEIREGDLIVVEKYDGNLNYLGTERGWALRVSYMIEGNYKDRVWEFEGMGPLYTVMTNCRLFKVVSEVSENYVPVDRASSWGSNEKPPVEGAKRIVDHVYPDGRERLRWEYPVNSLEDLKKISEDNKWETLVVGFDENGVTSVTVYDDYLE